MIDLSKYQDCYPFFGGSQARKQKKATSGKLNAPYKLNVEYGKDDFIEQCDKNGLLLQKYVKKGAKPKCYVIGTRRFTSPEEVAIYLNLHDWTVDLHLDDLMPPDDVQRLCSLLKSTQV